MVVTFLPLATLAVFAAGFSSSLSSESSSSESESEVSAALPLVTGLAALPLATGLASVISSSESDSESEAEPSESSSSLDSLSEEDSTFLAFLEGAAAFLDDSLAGLATTF